MKIFRLSSNDRKDLLNRTLTIGKWSYGIEPAMLNSIDHILHVVNNKFITTYIIRKKIQYRDLNTLIDDISKSRICAFKGTNKSKVVKIYIDNKTYYTRTKGRLRLKNRKFKTNLDWLRKELIDRGLEDTTPENYK